MGEAMAKAGEVALAGAKAIGAAVVAVVVSMGALALAGMKLALEAADAKGDMMLLFSTLTGGAVSGDEAVAMWNLYTGAAEAALPYDSVVVTGQKPDDALYLDLKDAHPHVHRIGDAVACRKLDHAIYEGYLAGIELFDPRERYIYEGELEAEAADLVHGD